MPGSWEPYGLIGDRWRALGGENSEFGKAVSDEFDVNLPWGSAGRARNFENGQIVYSPQQGPRMLVSAFVQGGRIVFEWGVTDPFAFDKWIVRWSIKGGNPVAPDAQRDVNLDGRGRARNFGFFHAPYPDDVIGSDGKRVGVCFIVEGYGGRSHSMRSWTCPIFRRL